MTDGLDPLQKEKILIISDRKEAINTAARLARVKRHNCFGWKRA